MKCNIKFIISLLVILFASSIIFYVIYFDNFFNHVSIKNINLVSYNSDKKNITLEILASNDEISCFVTNNKNIDSLGNFNKMYYNRCSFEGPVDDYYVFFKNKYGIISDKILINDYLYNINLKSTYYLAIGQTLSLEDNFLKKGSPNITFKISNDKVVNIENYNLIGKKDGNTDIQVFSNDNYYKSFTVIVTDAISVMPKNFNFKKPYLSCKQYSKYDANLLDKILEDRINEAGYKTRAGAVAAARFLTLEFPYRITYFFENGRVHPHDGNYADGEGRYYHKGLYLSTDKYKSISGSFAGPAIWGCPLMNFEDTNLFKYGKKYPNGLDCSGFVSWVLYNAGFDVKDIGAGESTWPYELTDLGDFRALTPNLIYSNEIKVGDLINDWGHIAIIVGIDDKNFYVAESLDIYGGVVLKTYPKKSVRDSFSYVVLMDELYLNDGNLKNMWH